MASDEITAEGGQVILRGSYLSTDAREDEKVKRWKGVMVMRKILDKKAFLGFSLKAFLA